MQSRSRVTSPPPSGGLSTSHRRRWSLRRSPTGANGMTDGFRRATEAGWRALAPGTPATAHHPVPNRRPTSRKPAEADLLASPLGGEALVGGGLDSSNPSRRHPLASHLVGNIGDVTRTVDVPLVDNLNRRGDFDPHQVKAVTVQMAVGRTTPMPMRSSPDMGNILSSGQGEAAAATVVVAAASLTG